MAGNKDSKKAPGITLPDYIPAALAEELRRDMTGHADMPEELGLFQRLASHPDMEDIYLKLGRRLSTPLDWQLFYSHLVVDAIQSELYKGAKADRAEFERHKRQAVRGLRDLIEGMEWIANPPPSTFHGYEIDFRENVQAHLLLSFAAALRGEEPPPARDIDPAEFLTTCRALLAILKSPSRQKDEFKEQNSGTAKRAVFVRAIARHLHEMAAKMPGSPRLLTAAEIATLTRVVFNQTKPDKDGRYMFTRDHVRQVLKGADY